MYVTDQHNKSLHAALQAEPYAEPLDANKLLQEQICAILQKLVNFILRHPGKFCTTQACSYS